MEYDVLALVAVLFILMGIHDINVIIDWRAKMKKDKKKSSKVETMWCSHCEEEVPVVTKMFDTKLCSKCGIILDGMYFNK